MDKVAHYNVQFFNRGGYDKGLSTINGMLTGYISDHYNLNKANELLADINAVLSSQYPLGGGQTPSLYLANITLAQTKLYIDMDAWENNNNITPDYVLPTTDFKVIVEAWRDYLMQ